MTLRSWLAVLVGATGGGFWVARLLVGKGLAAAAAAAGETVVRCLRREAAMRVMGTARTPAQLSAGIHNGQPEDDMVLKDGRLTIAQPRIDWIRVTVARVTIG